MKMKVLALCSQKGGVGKTTLCGHLGVEAEIKGHGPVALIDANVDAKGTRKAAQAYLEFLYTREAQEIIARRYYRPFDAEVLAANAARFPNVPLVTVQDVFLSWHDAHQMHFRDGGVFDQIRSSQ